MKIPRKHILVVESDDNSVEMLQFCSADASRADRRQGMSAGAQAYLARPCELEELRRTIRRLIAGALARGVGAGADRARA